MEERLKILMFSVGPVFPNHIHGGSQKILREVSGYLGLKGNAVRILCVQRPDNNEPFELAPNVMVLPILRLKQTYPEPYYTSPHNIAHFITTVRAHIEWCDIFYVHDAELPFHYLYEDRVTVFSFRDFVYPDTLVGGFGFQRDKLILSSDYVSGCVIDAFAPFRPGLSERIKVIPNGINLSRFVRTRGGPSPALAKFLRNPPASTYTLLCPHRPDSRKGMSDSVRITAEFQRRLKSRGLSVKLMVPIWMDSNIATSSNHEYQGIYADLLATAEDLGVRENVHLHSWIPYSLIPEYLSMGDVTLSVGSFVEAFGNVHLESVACGTPCVVSRVAAHAYNLPEPLVRKVAHGDVFAAVDCVEEYCRTIYDSAAAREFIRLHYSFDGMLQGYERVFAETTMLSPLTFEPIPPLSTNCEVRLAAWCRYDGMGIYNDYAYGRITNPRQVKLARRAECGVLAGNLKHDGFTAEEIETAIHDGVLVRVPTRAVSK